ncbi:MAG: hypothetical protein EXS31_06090, partial [Pedosphaera sp.]|nr:hypothetical protein [Pedosphaera sp.]
MSSLLNNETFTGEPDRMKLLKRIPGAAGRGESDQPVGPWAKWALLILLSAGPAVAENTNVMVKPPVPVPGGLSIHPVITSVGRTQDVVTVEWFGIQGPFQLLHSPSPTGPDWLPLAKPTFESKQSAPFKGDLGFFRVTGGRPVSTSELGGTVNYVGAAACVECHANSHHGWSETAHAKAFETLRTAKQEKNAACLTCHTVGFGTPLGFKDELSTPHLAGVQCENCHGPGGSHIANIRDASLRPKVTMSSEVCGGCHNGFHHPTFDEWKTSKHARVEPDVASSILAGGEPRMLACGVCHSGAVRESVLEQLEKPDALLPSREDAAYFGVACAVCHDAHSLTGNPRQLRNPTYSTNHFSYSTSTNTSFAAQYDPEIQVCAQCHNMRGARWQDTSRAPHHSPQYNLLIGQGGYDLGNPVIATHGLKIEKQCAHCHTHPHVASPATATSPNYTGHTFEVRLNGCVQCHISEDISTTIKDTVQTVTKSQIEQIRSLFDQWAATKAPVELKTKYGKLAWEYNNPGDLSNPTTNTTLRGPMPIRLLPSMIEGMMPEPCSWTFINATIFRSRTPFQISSDFFRTTKPAHC